MIAGHLEQAFEVAAAELGYCTASWLFAREAHASGGDALVRELRDALGRSFSVLDFVTAAWLGGSREPRVDAGAAADACAGITRIVVVGLEASFLDALVPLLSRSVRVALLRTPAKGVDWDRVLANYGGRVEGTDLGTFQGWAGSKSALLAFSYGAGEERAHIESSSLRAIGRDTRAQFRSIIGWEVLGGPLYVYPRWLSEVPLTEFSRLVI